MLFFLPCSPSTFFSSSLLFCEDMLKCLSTCQLGSIQKGGYTKGKACKKLKTLKAMNLGMPVFHNRGKCYFNFLLINKHWGGMWGQQWIAKAVALFWGSELIFGGGRGFFAFSWENLLWKKELKWFEVVVQYLIETWKPQVSGRLTLGGLSIA